MAVDLILTALGVLSAAWHSATLTFNLKAYRRAADDAQAEAGLASSSLSAKATVIVPCRGIDPEMKENIHALLSQDYPEYEIFFVVDSSADPAYQEIDGCLSSANGRAALITSGGPQESSGKIDALRAGVRHAGGEILVFADSDIRPQPHWLRGLVKPLLEDPTLGATTSYRWYFPRRGGFAPHLLSAWNAIAIDVLFIRKLNFVWGGSTALRRDLFVKLEIERKWRGEVSDDYVITRELRKGGYEIKFVPSSVSPSPADCTFKEFLEWATREMTLVRNYGPALWRAALATYTFSSLIALLGLASLVLVAFSALPPLPAILLALFIPFSLAKSLLRLRAFQRLIPGLKPAFRRLTGPYLLLSLVAGWFLEYILIRAGFRDKIVWRGRLYALRRGGQRG